MSPKTTTTAINDDYIKGIRSKEDDNNNNNNNNNTYPSKNRRQQRKGPGLLLGCCKPVVMDGVTQPIATGGSRHQKGSGLKGEQPALFRYIKVEEGKDGVAFPGLLSSSTSTSTSKSSSLSSSSSSSLDVEGVISNKKNKKCRKKFSRIVKAVLFETSLVKCRKDGKKSSQSNWKQSGDKVEKDSNTIKENSTKPVHEEPAKKDGATPLCPSSLLSNSRSSSERNLPSLNSTKTKQKKLQEEGKGCCTCDTGLCLLLVSLLFFLCWGKVCAILCTATWMFFLPCFNNGKKSLQSGVDLNRVIDSDEYKKRIVMEGLLDRNRSRGV